MNCCKCNKETDKPLTHYGELYCRECFYDTTGKCVCDNCNEVVPEWQAIVIPEEESCFCSEECANAQGYVECSKCEEFHDFQYMVDTDHYGVLCKDCIREII